MTKANEVFVRGVIARAIIAALARHGYPIAASNSAGTNTPERRLQMSDDDHGYTLGWNEGYAEGYACKLRDVTEPFMPRDTAPEIEAAATWLQAKYAAYFADRSDAIGLVRGVIQAVRGDVPQE